MSDDARRTLAVRPTAPARPSGRRPPIALFLLAMLLANGRATPAAAAELTPQTSQAYDAYLEQAQRDFLARAQREDESLPRLDGISASPAREDGIVGVPGGLIHHWLGRTYVPNTPLERVVEVSKSYGSYSRIYKAILDSRLLDHNGDTYKVGLRLKEGEAGITAIFELRSTVKYYGPIRGRAHSVSDADEIREVHNAGRRDERLLPPGRDSGYLWRASTFTRFVEHGGGVYIEIETLGLSRRFPAMLGWFIEPIARRLGRRSAENTLREFLAAIRTLRL